MLPDATGGFVMPFQKINLTQWGLVAMEVRLGKDETTIRSYKNNALLAFQHILLTAILQVR